MKRAFYIITALAFLPISCDLLDEESPAAATDGGADICRLDFRFIEENLQSQQTRSGIKLDTNAFNLVVKGQDGRELYNGRYAYAPESLLVEAGTYYIKVTSDGFKAPSFDCPQWGDEQYVNISQGQQNAVVELVCRQINCGVRMKIASGFLSAYPSSSLVLSSSDGSLLYSYSEKRTAFFNPGVIKLKMSTGYTDDVLLTRSLNSGDILCLNINVNNSGTAGASSGSPARIRVQVDTSRHYINETYIIGSGSASNKGSDYENAYTIAQAKDHAGEESVWVGGYIVGGDLTSKSMRTDTPFSSNSNLAIAPRASTTGKESCIAVQLPTGDVRDALNLVSNPENLGRYVYLKGDIVDSYFGICGLKNISDYVIK